MQHINIHLQGYKCTYRVFLQNLQKYNTTKKTSCYSYIATTFFIRSTKTRGTFTITDQTKVAKDRYPSFHLIEDF